MTVRTLNIRGTQKVCMCGFMIWMTADWNVPQGLIVIHDLLDVFHLLEVSPSNSGNCLAVSIMSTNGGSNPQTSQP